MVIGSGSFGSDGSFMFMSTSLSKFVNNLSESYSKKCRDKNCKSECD